MSAGGRGGASFLAGMALGPLARMSTLSGTVSSSSRSFIDGRATATRESELPRKGPAPGLGTIA
jgi:hypothetical protein